MVQCPRNTVKYNHSLIHTIGKQAIGHKAHNPLWIPCWMIEFMIFQPSATYLQLSETSYIIQRSVQNNVHATQAKDGLSETWDKTDRPKTMCTWQIQPRPGWHVAVFCTYLNLFYSIHFPFLFLFGFIWELCATATMHSALCHCPL